ncbi:MAG TPA: hypothetical protein VHT73_18315 [Thermodesulfobacteriota bacterium]|nr:hypothetical protein [Thermodesulfobacteriota bacterium]
MSKEEEKDKKGKNQTTIFKLVLTLEEYSFIAKRAKEENMPIADFLRCCIMCESLMSGNSECLAIFSSRCTEKTSEFLRTLMGSQDEGKSGKQDIPRRLGNYFRSLIKSHNVETEGDKKERG